MLGSRSEFYGKARFKKVGILSMRVEGRDLVIRVMEGRGIESKTYLPKGLPGRDYHGARFRGKDGLLHVCDGPVSAHPHCYCVVHEISESLDSYLKNYTREKSLSKE